VFVEEEGEKLPALCEGAQFQHSTTVQRS
jgi:hypothetical protein